MEYSLEKSEEQAEVIKMIALPVLMLDVEYCKEAAKGFLDQAHRQESMAVLNPNHSQIKNDILRKQGNALNFLCQYVESLKEIEKLKQGLQQEEINKAQIARMFL